MKTADLSKSCGKNRIDQVQLSIGLVEELRSTFILFFPEHGRSNRRLRVANFNFLKTGSAERVKRERHTRK